MEDEKNGWYAAVAPKVLDGIVKHDLHEFHRQSSNGLRVVVSSCYGKVTGSLGRLGCVACLAQCIRASLIE